jgi:chromosome segregation ATPase
MRHRNHLATALVALLGIGLFDGCASATQGEKMVQSYARTRETLAEAQNQVDTTLFNLTQLRTTHAQDLKNAFRAYKKAVSDLQSEESSAKWQATAMKGNVEENIAAWQREMETLKDPTIKASVQSRREAVRTNYALVRMYADDIRKAYDPFLQGNNEMIRALSIDLSPAALSGLAPAIDRVAADGVNLKQKLAAMQHALDNIANGVSPIGGT